MRLARNDGGRRVLQPRQCYPARIRIRA